MQRKSLVYFIKQIGKDEKDNTHGLEAEGDILCGYLAQCNGHTMDLAILVRGFILSMAPHCSVELYSMEIHSVSQCPDLWQLLANPRQVCRCWCMDAVPCVEWSGQRPVCFFPSLQRRGFVWFVHIFFPALDWGLDPGPLHCAALFRLFYRASLSH